eukprot:1452286-Karenia_brevis.AAC.1
MQYLNHLPEFVWYRLASLASGGSSQVVSTKSLRASTLHSALTSVAFIQHKVMSQATGQPFSLAQGDIAANIKENARLGAEHHHPIAAAVANLTRAGMPVQVITDALVLLKEVSWTSMIVEQAHASIS